MHSSFRISNSSDSLPLNIGATSIQKLQADKRSEEFKIYVELGLEATKLSASTDEEEEGETTKESETLVVEPHSFNVVATPLTKEFLIAEEKAKAREAARLEKDNELFNSDDYESEPLSQHVERRKNIGRCKQNTREPLKAKGEIRSQAESKQIYRRSQNERERVLAASLGQNHGSIFKDDPHRKPPDIPLQLPSKPNFNNPLQLPNLPTTPIPVSELPPTAVRSPPMKSPPMNPLLQNLTPIPPKQYTSRPPPNILNPPSQAKPAPSPSPARAASSDLISIQVPMAGPDGSQTLQTINVPRSVLAGASDRPILLTVTPKNGINKGQKQIVVLTKNTNGSTSASSRTATISTTNMTLNQKNNAAPAPGSPTKSVQLSPRAQVPTTQLSQASVAAMLAASQPVNPTIMATARSTQQQVITHGQASGVQQPVQQVVQHQQVVQQPTQVIQRQQQLVQQPQTLVQQPKQQVVQQAVQQQQVVRQQQQVVQQPQTVVRQGVAQPGARTAAAGQGGVKGGQVIRGHIVQTSQGQVLVQGNKQILLGNNAIQNGRLVLNQAQLQAITGAVASNQGQAVGGGGAQTKVVPGGQSVNKAVSVGQVRTQVISGGGQPVRTVMSVTQIQSMVSGGQLQTVIAGGRLQTVVSGSQAGTGGQVQTVAQSQTPGRSNPGQVILSPSQVGQVISGGGVQKVLTMSGGQQVVRVLSSGNGVQQGGAKLPIAVGTPRGQIIQNSASPQASSLPNGNSATSTPSAGGDSLSRIMAALHNRGLVSQQNGKFYYVGDKSKSPVSLSPGTAVKLAASSGITTSPAKPSQLTFSPGTGLSTAVSGISSLSNPNTTFSTPRSVSRMNTSTNNMQQSPGNQNTVVVANAANLDSYTADSSLLEMANTLLQSPVSSFSSNTSNQIPAYSSFTNGQAEVSPLKTSSQGEINNQTFYYRDLGLPVGWYIRIDKRLIGDCSYEVDTSFFSPDGACLKSQKDISAYLTGQLVVEDRSHKAPVSVNLLPWKDDLNEINKQFVPNIDISGASGYALSDATSHNFLKRSLSATQDLGMEKKSKSDNFFSVIS